MPPIWIVHREEPLRSALARMAGAGRDALTGGPTDPGFDASPAPEAVVLGVAGDFEQELEFAHRMGRRHPDAAWILVAQGEDADEAGRLFDTLSAPVLPLSADAAGLRRRLRMARHRRRAQALSQRQARDAVAARFGRWFADLELPAVLRALDPRLSEVPLLIRGEPGTGRGVLAAYVHAFGGSEGGHLARIACRGVEWPELLIEIGRAGREAPARRGLTLCLEEVETLSQPAQHRLRTWIESGLPSAARTGAGPIRWIATCGEDGPLDPAESLDPGLARTLAALEVRLPPLRERREAIEPFAADTALAWCTAHGEAPRRFDSGALGLLTAHPWPGNLRELEAVVVRTLAAGCAEHVRAEDLRFEAAPEEWPEPVTAYAEEPVEPTPPEPADEEPVVTAEPDPLVTTARAEEPVPPPPEAPPSPQAAAAAAGAQRAESERSLTKLVAAMSHEVRNPLVAIRTFSQLLPERFDDPEFRGRYAEIVGDDVRRIEHALDRLSRFAALGPPSREPVDVAGMLDELLEARREEIQGRRLVVLRELDRDQPEALGDAAQLRFAFESLLGKALELVPERGDVYLASKHHPDGLDGGPSIRVLLRFQSPDEIIPTVDVEGISLAETALEIAVADAIVRAQGGTMSHSPAGNRETVILIDLPA